MKNCGLVALATVALFTAARAQDSFYNYETPTVHPLALSPDGAILAACNLPDARIEFFDLASGSPVPAGWLTVGIDPVSVRFRTASELWVVNHISDSISIVDVPSRRILHTIRTGDEPCDVVFAGTPQRAFVTCSQSNTVEVYDPAARNRTATIPIRGEEPRALAVSPDGATVYAAIFESGNQTTIVAGGITSSHPQTFPPNVASDPTGPYAGTNPPPNDGADFDPPINEANGTPPRVGLIVKHENGDWIDDNGRVWTSLVSGADAAKSGRPVGWKLLDHDLAIIDANTNAIRYADGLMNICMTVAVNPVTGKPLVVGTEALNHVRYEPVLIGRFIRVYGALVDPAATPTAGIGDLNTHLDYSSVSVEPAERALSIGDPRAIVWESDGQRGWIAGMGSNNVVAVDANGDRIASILPIGVGAGPTGLAMDDARSRLYVLNRFDGSLSTIDTDTRTEVARTPFLDPTPAIVRAGRRHLYNTHETSGLGIISCASCHVDARLDRLAWDLGDPAATATPVTSASHNLGFGLPIFGDGFTPHHPMKGPMLTQTLQDIIGHEPLHWRGDRLNFREFNPTFVFLHAADRPLNKVEMDEFIALLRTISYPPNPFRNLDNTLPTNLPLPGQRSTGRFSPAGTQLPNGNAQAGHDLYRSTSVALDQGTLNCAVCHALPTGGGASVRWDQASQAFVPQPPGPDNAARALMISRDEVSNVSMKVPHLRNAYERLGMDFTQTENTAGFGFMHDGAMDSMARFLSIPLFTLRNDQDLSDLIAFTFALSGSDLPVAPFNNILDPPGIASNDSHAATGQQESAVETAPSQRLLEMVEIAAAPNPRLALIAKTTIDGVERGWLYEPAAIRFLSDRDGEWLALEELLALSSETTPITFTLVPAKAGRRLGIDRDEDDAGDRTERDFDTDPADPSSRPERTGNRFTLF